MFEFYCGGFAAVPLARGSDLWLEPAQFEAARTDPRFHLYVVESIRQGDPGLFRLIDLHGEQFDRLLSRARTLDPGDRAWRRLLATVEATIKGAGELLWASRRSWPRSLVPDMRQHRGAP